MQGTPEAALFCLLLTQTAYWTPGDCILLLGLNFSINIEEVHMDSQSHYLFPAF
jgi:hypothetical protein